MKILSLLFCLALLSQMGYSQQAVEYAPDFSMSRQDFESQALEAKDEVWVVDFWASWCGPCIQSVPHMKALHQHYAGKKVRFISISWDKEATNWQKALLRLAMPWQHFRLEAGEDAFFNRYFRHSGIPTAFVIGKNGKPKRVSDVYALEKVIDKALSK